MEDMERRGEGEKKAEKKKKRIWMYKMERTCTGKTIRVAVSKDLCSLISISRMAEEERMGHSLRKGSKQAIL